MRLAVAIIHGIGTQTRAFAAPMIAELEDRLEDRGHDPDDVAFQPIHWADILDPRQRAYLDAARAAGPLDFLALRRYVVTALGDAAAYQYVDGPSATYVLIHTRIRERLRDLFVDGLGSSTAPLVVLAHSLGSHIMSNYIWDTQRAGPTGAGAAAGAFERFETLAGMVTFGSNIPLFTFARSPVTPIDFPGPGLTPEMRARARWLNYYDRDDILGYPLRPTSPGYAAVVHADVEINVGGFGVSATPLSHNGYWTDNDFTRPVADFLAGLLDV